MCQGFIKRCSIRYSSRASSTPPFELWNVPLKYPFERSWPIKECIKTSQIYTAIGKQNVKVLSGDASRKDAQWNIPIVEMETYQGFILRCTLQWKIHLGFISSCKVAKMFNEILNKSFSLSLLFKRFHQDILTKQLFYNLFF